MFKFKEKFSIYLLWGLIFFVNLYKLLLINRGFLTFPDERRYLMSWSALKHLLQADFQGTVIPFFSAQARPGSVLLHTLPASLQFFSAKIFGFELFESANSWGFFVYNLLIFGLTLFLLYKIFSFLFSQKLIVLTGLLWYSVLVNSFVYLRHTFPYNESLLVYLFLIFQMISTYKKHAPVSYKGFFIWGIMAFVAHLIYPAYYLSFLSVFILMNLLFYNKDIYKWIKQNLVYISGVLVAFLFTEALSGWANTSYIHNLLQLSDTVKQGSFEESYSFIFKYFMEVEKLAGILLIIGIIVFFLNLPRLVNNKDHKLLFFLWISFFSTYFLHTTMGYFFHKMTIYARILHQFIPVIIVMNLYVLSLINENFRRKIISVLAIFISMVFVKQIHSYLQIYYPRDVYWQYLKTYPKEHIVQLSEYKHAWSNLPEKVEGKYVDLSGKDSIYVVNGMFFYPYDTPAKLQLKFPENSELLFNGLHFIQYKAYQYEGLNMQERSYLDSLQFHIKVLKKR